MPGPGRLASHQGYHHSFLGLKSMAIYPMQLQQLCLFTDSARSSFMEALNSCEMRLELATLWRLQVSHAYLHGESSASGRLDDGSVVSQVCASCCLIVTAVSAAFQLSLLSFAIAVMLNPLTHSYHWPSVAGPHEECTAGAEGMIPTAEPDVEKVIECRWCLSFRSAARTMVRVFSLE